MQETNDKIKVHMPELTPLDLVRAKYRAATTQPKGDVLTEEDLSNLPERDRTSILEARARRSKRMKRR